MGWTEDWKLGLRSFISCPYTDTLFEPQWTTKLPAATSPTTSGEECLGLEVPRSPGHQTCGGRHAMVGNKSCCSVAPQSRVPDWASSGSVAPGSVSLHIHTFLIMAHICCAERRCPSVSHESSSLGLDHFAQRKELLHQYHPYAYSNILSVNMTSLLIFLPLPPLNEEKHKLCSYER